MMAQPGPLVSKYDPMLCPSIAEEVFLARHCHQDVALHSKQAKPSQNLGLRRGLDVVMVAVVVVGFWLPFLLS